MPRENMSTSGSSAAAGSLSSSEKTGACAAVSGNKMLRVIVPGQVRVLAGLDSAHRRHCQSSSADTGHNVPGITGTSGHRQLLTSSTGNEREPRTVVTVGDHHATSIQRTLMN